MANSIKPFYSNYRQLNTVRLSALEIRIECLATATTSLFQSQDTPAFTT